MPRKPKKHPRQGSPKVSRKAIMIIWECKDWQTFLSSAEHRTGLRFRFEKNVDASVRKAILDFSHWMKQNYAFPLRVVVYVKHKERIKACDGESVCGTFFRPYTYGVEPYIRIATGDYSVLKKQIGRDNALASILVSLAHELTHYYQYINKTEQTLRGEEIQAGRTASIILDRYALTRDHP